MRNLYFALALIFIAGLANGLHETIHYHWSDFQNVFPKADPHYWNPYVSWTNKYKNHDAEQGEAFLLSTTALVGFTDAKHLLGELHRESLALGCMFFGYWYRSLRHRYHWAILAGWGGALWLLQVLGFHILYTFVF
jgi:hypothetical protein